MVARPVRRRRGAQVAMAHIHVGAGVAPGGGEGEGGGAPCGADGQELTQGGLEVVVLGLVHLEVAGDREDGSVGLVQATVFTGEGDICEVKMWEQGPQS